jgi:aryl-alcohol dehydrogenase-like predicted oxidoreductase
MSIEDFPHVKVSACPIGLGLAALGRPGYINLGHATDLKSDYDVESMQQRTHEVLDYAWEAGVRYFDAARSYGRAEEFLSSWLESRAIEPNEVTVASKWGYTYTADWKIAVADGHKHEVKQHSVDRLNQQYPESTKLLGAHMDLYQIHSATLESGVLSNDAVLDRLAQLRDRGLRMGLSVSGATQSDVILRAIDCERGGRPIFSAVQATWNLLEQSVGFALQTASDQGWVVVVKEGVANGRLTDRNNDPDFSSKRDLLQSIADQHDASMDAVALAVILRQPWSKVVLSGAATKEQLNSNLLANEFADQLSEDELSQLTESLIETPETYWANRSGLKWN